MTKIVGIDPGLAATGVGVVWGVGRVPSGCSYGCITTTQALALPQRLEKIFDKTSAVLGSEKPNLVVVEDVFTLSKYPKSAISLSAVTGVVLLAASQHKIAVKQIPVREAKRVLTGNGSASKAQLEKSVRQRLGLTEKIRPEHAADALGLALIGFDRLQVYSR